MNEVATKPKKCSSCKGEFTTGRRGQCRKCQTDKWLAWRERKGNREFSDLMRCWAPVQKQKLNAERIAERVCNGRVREVS